MMNRRRPVAVAACLAFSLVLAACASKPPRGPTVDAAAKSQGTFKVGKPYQVNGTWYYPSLDLNYDETGIASWYGPDFHEQATANGETFDQNSLSAAHKTLPLPSIVQVTNLDNGRSIEVRSSTIASSTCRAGRRSCWASKGRAPPRSGSRCWRPNRSRRNRSPG
jgi:rare lipoprotein A